MLYYLLFCLKNLLGSSFYFFNTQVKKNRPEEVPSSVGRQTIYLLQKNMQMRNCEETEMWVERQARKEVAYTGPKGLNGETHHDKSHKEGFRHSLGSR